jgi:hypothetical protein
LIACDFVRVGIQPDAPTAPAPFGSSLDRRAVLAAPGMIAGDIGDLPVLPLPESLPIREAS